MQDVVINYWALLSAAVAAMVVGAVWYGVLSKPWMEASGITKEKIEADRQRGMKKEYLLSFVSLLVISYVFIHILTATSSFFEDDGLTVKRGLSTAFWLWLGFMAPATLINQLWEGRPFKLLLINAGHFLAVLLVVGAILGGWV